MQSTHALLALFSAYSLREAEGIQPDRSSVHTHTRTHSSLLRLESQTTRAEAGEHAVSEIRIPSRQQAPRAEARSPAADQKSIWSFPFFESLENLKANPTWYKYLTKLYGTTLRAADAFPMNTSRFWVIRRDLFVQAGGSISPVGNCPNADLEMYSGWNGKDGADLVRIHHNFPYDRFILPDNSAVEITHQHSCADSTELETYWMYYAPGSGIFYKLGRTKAFAHHEDAIHHFLPGKSCGSGVGLECVDFFSQMAEAARGQYDSLQFWDHHDLPCGGGYEIVDLRNTGNDMCSIQMHAGIGARCPCSGCEKEKRYLYCEVNCSAEHRSLLNASTRLEYTFEEPDSIALDILEESKWNGDTSANVHGL